MILTAEQLDALESKAKAATGEDWYVDGFFDVSVIDPVDWEPVVIASTVGVGRDNNAEHIAAANPSTILALIAEVRELRVFKEEILARASSGQREGK